MVNGHFKSNENCPPETDENCPPETDENCPPGTDENCIIPSIVKDFNGKYEKV